MKTDGALPDVRDYAKLGPTEREALVKARIGQGRFRDELIEHLHDLRARARQQLEADFRAWLNGFSPNVQDILDNFEFRNQIPRLSKADALGTLIEKLTSPDINLPLRCITRVAPSNTPASTTTA